MVSAICTVNGRSISTTGTSGINVSGGSTITVALSSSIGVTGWSIVATNADDLTAGSGLVAINNSMVKTGFSATFVMPNADGYRGASVQFTSTVNPGTAVSDTVTFGVFVLNSNGTRLFFGNQTNESNATVGNAADLNAMLQVATTGASGVTPGGDLGGTVSSQIVIGLQGIALSSTPPTTGQALVYNGTEYVPATQSGSIVFGGDLTGNSASQTVVGLQGKAVSNTAPTDGQVLQYNSGTSKWTPTTGATTVTWANDLSGSTASNQYINSISGHAGSGNVPVSVNASQLQLNNPTASIPSIIPTLISSTPTDITICGQGTTGSINGGNLNLLGGLTGDVADGYQYGSVVIGVVTGQNPLAGNLYQITKTTLVQFSGGNGGGSTMSCGIASSDMSGFNLTLQSKNSTAGSGGNIIVSSGTNSSNNASTITVSGSSSGANITSKTADSSGTHYFYNGTYERVYINASLTSLVPVNCNAGLSILPTTVNASTYTVQNTDGVIFVSYTATGACTITLYNDILNGQVVIIKDTGGFAGTNHITVSPPAGGYHIDGGGSQTISSNYGVLRLVGNGNNWFTF